MKSFYQFYQKILKEAGAQAPGTPPPAGGATPPAPPGGAPPAGGAAGAPPAGAPPAGGAGAPPAGQGTSPPVPPPDQNLAQAVTMLGKVTDPKAKQMVDQFMKQLQGAGIQIPGSPTAPPNPAAQGKAPAPGTPPAPGAPGTPPAPPK